MRLKNNRHYNLRYLCQEMVQAVCQWRSSCVHRTLRKYLQHHWILLKLILLTFYSVKNIITMTHTICLL